MMREVVDHRHAAADTADLLAALHAVVARSAAIASSGGTPSESSVASTAARFSTLMRPEERLTPRSDDHPGVLEPEVKTVRLGRQAARAPVRASVGVDRPARSTPYPTTRHGALAPRPARPRDRPPPRSSPSAGIARHELREMPTSRDRDRDRCRRGRTRPTSGSASSGGSAGTSASCRRRPCRTRRPRPRSDRPRPRGTSRRSRG